MTITFNAVDAETVEVPNPDFNPMEPEDAIFNSRTLSDLNKDSLNVSNSNGIRILRMLGLPEKYAGQTDSAVEPLVALIEKYKAKDEIAVYYYNRLIFVLVDCLSRRVGMQWS